jgi:CBS domain-containing protein
MKIREVMTENVLSVRPETTLKEVARMLVENHVSGVPVCDPDGRPLGVVSEGDILFKERGPDESRRGPLAWLLDGSDSAHAVKAEARTAAEAMTSPAITVEPYFSLAEAARLMGEHRVNRLPVVQQGALVGIVTRADLVRAFQRSDEEIAKEIREDVFARALWIDPHSLRLEVEAGEVTIGGQLEAESEAHRHRPSPSDRGRPPARSRASSRRPGAETGRRAHAPSPRA